MLAARKRGTMVERRVDFERRKRVSEMSPEELRRALLISEKTGLPNRRAFEEAPPSPYMAMVDVNGLKALNDKFGYAAGDILINRLAEVLVSVQLDTYHDKGDEFLCKGQSFRELNSKLAQAQQLLEDEPFAVPSVHDRMTTINGASFCFGIGTNMMEAERSLKNQKELRKVSSHEIKTNPHID